VRVRRAMWRKSSGIFRTGWDRWASAARLFRSPGNSDSNITPTDLLPRPRRAGPRKARLASTETTRARRQRQQRRRLGRGATVCARRPRQETLKGSSSSSSSSSSGSATGACGRWASANGVQIWAMSMAMANSGERWEQAHVPAAHILRWTQRCPSATRLQIQRAPGCTAPAAPRRRRCSAGSTSLPKARCGRSARRTPTLPAASDLTRASAILGPTVSLRTTMSAAPTQRNVPFKDLYSEPLDRFWHI
jgi:hypothetical protein